MKETSFIIPDDVGNNSAIYVNTGFPSAGGPRN